MSSPGDLRGNQASLVGDAVAVVGVRPAEKGPRQGRPEGPLGQRSERGNRTHHGHALTGPSPRADGAQPARGDASGVRFRPQDREPQVWESASQGGGSGKVLQALDRACFFYFWGDPHDVRGRREISSK